MPRPLARVNRRIEHLFGVSIRICKNKTPTPNDTHENAMKCVNRNKNVYVLPGFEQLLKDARKIQDVKVALAKTIRLDGEQLDPHRFAIISKDKRTLHGSKEL